ncbi:MAG: hypothetical protein DF280_01990 ['Brassica napus' phytoplasma]|nr:MAG: hypothetical protein DF280_01990 ['Brassica napus' phytoplasma]
MLKWLTLNIFKDSFSFFVVLLIKKIYNYTNVKRQKDKKGKKTNLTTLLFYQNCYMHIYLKKTI